MNMDFKCDKSTCQFYSYGFETYCSVQFSIIEKCDYYRKLNNIEIKKEECSSYQFIALY
jgi:hypothetical protein